MLQVATMSTQRGHRLTDSLQMLRNSNRLLEELMAWLNEAENTLVTRDQQSIPQDKDIIMELIKEHQVREMSSHECLHFWGKLFIYLRDVLRCSEEYFKHEKLSKSYWQTFLDNLIGLKLHPPIDV